MHSLMKTLLLMRHAKSSWKESNIPDHDRPLNRRGKHDAPLMGKLLRDQKINLDLIISSTALRAETTANLIAKAVRYKGKIILDKSVYNAEPMHLLNLLSNSSDEYNSILLVGHNPTMEETVQMITNSPEITMATCAIAHLTLSIDAWTDLKEKQTFSSKLENFWTPKELFY
jgi:phosphohistidine phosphatase